VQLERVTTLPDAGLRIEIDPATGDFTTYIRQGQPGESIHEEGNLFDQFLSETLNQSAMNYASLDEIVVVASDGSVLARFTRKPDDSWERRP
jgi:hypothetical protein